MTRTKLPILTLLFFLLNSLASLAAAPEVCILGRRAAQDAAVVLPANASTILRSSQRSGKQVHALSYCLPSSERTRSSTS